MITDVPGIRVGHWTDAVARTGCTVVLFPEDTVASGEVRGGAPATREWALLAPERLVQRLDAVVLAGGSAFGLAACDGVMAWCEERGLGFPTAAGPVPIVVGAALYDLTEGDPAVRPGPSEGLAACEAATTGPLAVGQVGAGAGATVGKWAGRDAARPGGLGTDAARPGGLGTATCRSGDLVVGALVAVNAFGDLRERVESSVLAAAVAAATNGEAAFANTTIGVVATNATLPKTGCLVVAQGAHDGVARALVPAHATVDGDAFVAAAVGGVAAPVDLVRLLAADATEAAIRAALAPAS